MAALTSQDYKAQRRATRDTQRLKDFGYGAACGALLTGIACAWLGAHSRLAAPLPHAPPASAGPGAAPAAETYTYPKRLPGHELDVPLPPRNPGQDVAAAKTGQGR